MGTETNRYKPDEFAQHADQLNALFADIGIPLPGLGEIALKRHLEIVPDQKPEPRSHEQQAAEFFGQSIFPPTLRPAS